MREIIGMLSPQALVSLERYLRKILHDVQSSPSFRSYTEVLEARAKARDDALSSGIATALDRIDAGLPEADAAAMLAREAGRYPSHAAHMLSRARIERDRSRRAERKATVAKLLREGYSNADIARACGCSVHTAARLAAQAKGERR